MHHRSDEVLRQDDESHGEKVAQVFNPPHPYVSAPQGGVVFHFQKEENQLLLSRDAPRLFQLLFCQTLFYMRHNLCV